MFKSGFVAVIGVPNAGKSSLVNRLVRESVSIVTSKPQTTRKRTLGIVNKDEGQIVFVDTPGIIDTNDGLNPFLRKELFSALEDVNVVIAAVAPWEFRNGAKPWITTLDLSGRKIIYVLTQGDLFKENLEKMESINDQWRGLWKENAPDLHVTSSMTGMGVGDLEELIWSELPEGPKYYDDEIYTPQTMREMAGEIIRKRCFEFLRQEIPYGLAVLIQDFKEEQIYKIEADIVVSRESHKKIVIGQGGQGIKTIGTNARQEMEQLFGRQVFVKLHVIVRENWMRDKNWLEQFGYNHA